MATTVGVVVFPGTNCEMDAIFAVEGMGGEGRLLWHADDDIGGVDAVIVPGGFAHGDYLRPGAIARFSPMMGAGTSRIGDQEFSWSRGDTIAAPIWHWIEHRAEEDTVLFSMSDENLMRFANYYRFEGAE